MSTFAVCAKRLFLDIADAQSNPRAATLNETAYAILNDSQSYLQRKIQPGFEDGVGARVAIYRPPFNCNVAAECSTPLCEVTEGINNKPHWEWFDIDGCVTTNPYFITVRDYEAACNGTLRQAFTDQVMLAIDELKRFMNINAKAFISANAGNWTDGSLTKVLPIAAATTGEGLFPSWTNLQYQFVSVGITTKPNVLGGAALFGVKTTLGITNPNTGFSPTSAGPVTLYIEPLFDAPGVTPANQLFAWSPQTVQLVTYNRYLGDFAQGPNVKSASDVIKVWQASALRATGAIPILFYSSDPSNPTPIRVWAEFEGMADNCGNFKFALSIQYKFVTMITDMCDESGFNGILKMTTCPPVVADCPAAPDPVVPNVYCFGWDGVPCENPYSVNSVSFGGNNYSSVPMDYDGTEASLVLIINTFVGKEIVYIEGGIIKSAWPLSAGSLNDGAYSFTFTDCTES